jgi:uncharacterized membrane protein YedE/YeeE
MELISSPLLAVEWLRMPWHWAVSGAALSSLVFLMTWMGKRFGISSSFNNICAAAGAGRFTPFFKERQVDSIWRYFFVVGTILGGFIASTFLSSPEAVAISQETISSLESYGYSYPEMDATGAGFIPTQFINYTSLKGILIAIAGGFMVGFGARYAGGCTSGHAITGLSHLQLPSLITVIGFFIGGLLMTHFILPFLL